MNASFNIHSLGDTIFPATRQQEGVWFHAMRDSSSYWNFVSVKSFKGAVNIDALKKSLEIIVKRHSALRTNIVLNNNTLYQIIRNEVKIEDYLIVSQYDKVSTGESIHIVNDAISTLQMSNYDFKSDVLVRFQVIQFRSVVFFLLSLNHIVTDAVSMQLFWSELAQYYNSIVNGKDTPMQVAGQYAEFALAQQEYFRTEKYSKQKKYWQDKLSQDFVVPELPFCSQPGNAEVYAREIELPIQLSEDARSFALRKKVTYSSLFQLAYAIVLYKYSAQEKIVIGNIVNGRGYGKKSYPSTIGFFADRIINIFKLNERDTLGSLLQQVNQTMLEAFKYGDIPYEDIMREYNEGKKTGMAPLFTAAFNLIKNQQQEINWEGLESYHNPVMSRNMGASVNNQYEIYLFVIDNPDKVRLRLELLCDKEHATLIDLVMDSFIHILKKIIYAPQTHLSKQELLTDTEKNLYREFNHTELTLPGINVIHEVFRAATAKHPRKTAVIAGGQSMTYGKLDSLSDRWSTVITTKNNKPEQPIGLLLNRSAALLPAMLAILKAGHCYLPLDPDFPPARLNYMLADAGVSLVITEESLKDRLPATIEVLTPGEMNDTGPVWQVVNRNTENDLAYVIYTSGSTGQPKGVMIEHKAVVNFSKAISNLVDCNGRKIYSLTTIGFDIFILESIHALCSGATVILADKEAQDNPVKAANEIIQHKADIVQFTPTRAKLMLQGAGTAFLSNLSAVLIGGEMLDMETLRELQKHCPGSIYNMYGPTETTVWSCVKDLTENEFVTIGKPIANTEVYILDKQNQHEGIGIFGEIAIAGNGLSRGYWNRPELTAEKFISFHDKKLYRTGDTGRWLPNGELEIIGRKDEQVKIRGYRVEPGEIEFHIKKFKGIKDAVVIYIRNEKCDDLFACYTSSDIINHTQLRNELKNVLPTYMVPGYFIRFETIPLTPNNKTDKVTLARLAKEWINTFREESEPGTSQTGNRIEMLWWNILQIDRRSGKKISSNFFEAGGHSLKALLLLEQVEKKFNIVVPVRDFFQNPTLDFLQNSVTTETLPELAGTNL